MKKSFFMSPVEGERFTIPACVELEEGKFTSKVEALKDPELRDKVIAKYQAEVREKMDEFDNIIRLLLALAEGRISPEDL